LATKDIFHGENLEVAHGQI